MYRHTPNRYLCDILTDMRTAIEKLRFDLVPGLVEEAQIYANRMEAQLDDQYDLKALLEKKRELDDEVRELEKKKEAVKEWLGGEENEEKLEKLGVFDSISDRSRLYKQLQNHPRDDGDAGC